MAARVADEDIAYEEDVLRNPYSLRSWLRYLDWKQEAPLATRTVLYERALHHLPGSYKLWFVYLQERIAAVKERCITHPTFEIINRTFERALVFMHKMPRIWIEYLNFLTRQLQYTRTRRTFDRALRALPVSQHDKIWALYLKFVRSIPDCPDTVVRVYRRYLRLHPTKVEDYIEFLVNAKLYEEAIYQLAKVVNAEETAPEKVKKQTENAGKRKELWLQLCDLVSKNPDKSKGLNVDAAIRTGVRRFTDEVGRLWTALADYYIRLGHFEKARDVFEEALGTVTSVKDFAQIWDAYVLFEDSIVAAKMEAAATASEPDVPLELDLLVARYEALVSRRALLLSSVMLRQNPNNVREWHKRVKLFEDPVQVIETYNNAIKTVDPMSAKGKPHTLWVNFANFYEAQEELEYARQVFERGTEATFRSPDELAALWCEYVEFELRHKNYDAARALMGRATAVPSAKKAANMSEVQKKLHKQAKLWSLAADLEESFGTFATTKAVYERALDLKVATPLLVINYAQYLEQNNYFEESFKAYERGVQLFTYPYVFDLWLTYLTKFVARYGGRKLERARDLFEQALEKAPPAEAKVLYMMFAALEEEHGLARHAMAVYDRAVKSLAEEDRPAMYLIYVARAAEFFGITRTRQIFEQAIEALPEKYVREMCLRFAELEKKLGEIDRARGIYQHCSQFCDPRADAGFWKTWSDFEVKHGNQDTFKEMLRVRRSVQAKYATSVMPFVAKDVLQPGAEQPRVGGDRMAALEAAAPAPTPMEETRAPHADPDAIDVSEERPGKQARIEPDGVEQKELPAGLFGSAKDAAAEEAGGEKLGALERLRRKK